MIKKAVAIIMTLVMTGVLLCSCTDEKTDEDKLNVVCTVFPYYDWAKNIVGENDNVKVSFLLDTGTDLHSYQPTAADIVTITSADIFIYTGGESDKWVEDVLATSKNSDTTAINLMDNISVESLYCVEAIETAHNHSHESEEHHHEEGEEHIHTYDEHIWLSLNNAVALTEVIKDALAEKDSENKSSYEENFEDYKQQLLSLHKEYEKAVEEASQKTLIFADRFPFIYLIKDYGLEYYAAFSGCSAESEASFETVTALAKKTDELSLSYILISETSDGSIAKTVKGSTENKNQEILTLNALQSVTKDKADSSYIEIMTENLKILTKALS